MRQRASVDLNPEDFVFVDGFATPPSPPYRPLHALLSAFRLVLNKEDTRQVFETVTAVTRDSSRELFARFIATPYGRRVVTEPVELEAILGDFPRLRALAPGTIGRAYFDFMDDAGFTPQGLLDAADEAGVGLKEYPELKGFGRAFRHLEVSHDLWHVLTGYGRDPLGELCNLVFTQQQTKNRGLNIIIAMGATAIKLERWTMPVLKSLKEARRMGKAVDFLVKEDIGAMLETPLVDVRKRLGIFTPTVYNSVPQSEKSSVLRPKVKRTQSEREQDRGIPQAA